MSSMEIVEILQKLGDFIVAEWSRDFESDGDYLLINRMKYAATTQEEEEFECLVLTGHAMARYIDEQLQCQACLADLTPSKQDTCKEENGRLGTKKRLHS
uniref:Uncharacterized protein n=1 Tax=Glossina morsitans morsitans TaxID=37546 RepID=A0ABK9NG53_GLOMM